MSDRRWMRYAFNLASRGQGQTWPNPSVGCVIVKDGELVGRGWTARGGRPHAETMALAEAGVRASGAIAFVTLEPCSHHGVTPPCVDAILHAGIRKVVVAMEDPDARVAGRGLHALRESGVKVRSGCLGQHAEDFYRGYRLCRVCRRPGMTLKMASSLDGRVASADGHSQWITGPESRKWVHALRARHDAVLVGRGTVVSDDPMLTARLEGCRTAAVRVFLDTGLTVSPDNRLARTANDVPLWILHCHDRLGYGRDWLRCGAKLLHCARDSTGRVDLVDAVRVLASQGLTSVFCEGGPTLAASLLAADLVDELIWFNAGLLLGAEGKPAAETLPWKSLSAAPRLEFAGILRRGNDVMHRWLRT